MDPNKFTAKPGQTAAHVEPTIEFDDLPPGIRDALEQTALRKTYSAARFAPKDVTDLRTLAEEWYDSDLLPESYYPEWEDKQKRPIVYSQQELQRLRRRGISRAVIVMRYGAALGVLPEIAILLIYIIDNQPRPAAGLMLAIFLSSPICAVFEPVSSTAAAAKMRVGRKGQKAFDVEATYAEYKHLHSRKNWTNYPTDMVYARCLGRAMRRAAPDLFAGVYCAEEAVDFRADRAAGTSDGALDRILGAVELENRTSPRVVSDEEQAPPVAPVPVAETAQGVAPVVDVEQVKKDLNALGKRLDEAKNRDSISGEEIEEMRSKLESFNGVSPVGYGVLLKKWNDAPFLGPYVVAS